MCEYCKEAESGDLVAQDIIYSAQNAGFLGDFLVFGRVDYGELQIAINNSHGCGDIDLTREINYCPMCGRKLREETK